MISLEQAKKILLEHDEQYSEAELELIYESLKAQVKIIIQIPNNEKI